MKKQSLTSPSRSRHLDNPVRSFIQNPQRILKGYVKEGMFVLDVGCGPGLFSYGMAKMVGKNGKVVATEVQQEMLDKLKNKIKGLEVEKTITLHKSKKNNFGLNEKFDFILAFYVLHEVENKKGFFEGLKKLMKKNTPILLTEPLFHISKNDFEEMLSIAEDEGFEVKKRPKIRLSRAALLTR